MPEQHAKLSASGSSRWMACSGSVVLESLLEDEGSIFAEEGTKAHSVAEARLRAILEGTSEDRNILKLEKTTEAEMWAFAGKYVEYCTALCDTIRLSGHDVRTYVERRIRFDRWVHEGFGTVDFIAIGGDELHIVDFKYGKGVPVDAIENTQMRMYALGVLQEYECIFDNLKTVTMHIVQPRISNYSQEVMHVDDLLQWAETELKPKADRAAAATREYAIGSHCRFCRAKAICKARATYLLNRVSTILGGNELC